MIHKFSHLAAWAELNCLVVLVHSDGMPRRPVVHFSRLYRFFSAVGVLFYSVAGIIYGYTGESMTPTVSGPEMEGTELDEEA